MACALRNVLQGSAATWQIVHDGLRTNRWHCSVLPVLKAGACSEDCANANATLDAVTPYLWAQFYFRLCQLNLGR
ncbi:hypothetical protein WJX82_004327 [Trebouxia sp. C0006]